MRLSLIGLSMMLLQSVVMAQDKPPPPKPASCFYTVGSQSVEVAVGASVCRRAPAPYQDQYALLRCGPPLDELALVKRGDARCERYEERQ